MALQKTSNDKIQAKYKTNLDKSSVPKDAGLSYKVPQGTTLYSLARAFNFKNVDEFKKYAGLSANAQLKAGMNLKVPTIELETTFSAIANKYNMTLQELQALNPQIKDYTKVKKGTPINIPLKPFDKKTQEKTPEQEPVKTQPVTTQSINKPTTENKKVLDSTFNEKGVDSNLNINHTSPKNAVTTSNINTTEIAKALKKSSRKWGAIDSKSFQEAFAKINKDNVIDVIKEYNKISDGESLIEMIADEITNDENIRKNTIKNLFTMLANAAGNNIADKKIRDDFSNELNKQFNSMWVSTNKMDKMINKIIELKENFKVTEDTEVMLENGEVKTAGELQAIANKAAKKDGVSVSRPLPIISPEGKIVADVQEFEPTGDGALNGKTIIVNAGHGGYNPKNGLFDRGTMAKDANGKTVEEFYKNQNFVNEIIPELQAQGAKVVYMSGTVASITQAQKDYAEEADMFISIHCDSNKKSSVRGQTIIYNPEKEDGKNLADIVEKNIQQHDWIVSDKCKTRADDRGLGVLKAMPETPAIIIETGFQSNKQDLANIDSSKFRKEFANHVTNAVISYLNPSEIEEDYPRHRITETTVSSLEDVANSLDITSEFITKLKRAEDTRGLDDDSFHNERYKDKAGNWTIGIGHLWKEGEATYLTDEEVCQVLKEDLQKAQDGVKRVIGNDIYTKLPQSIREALIDMAFNKGPGIIRDNPSLIWALKNERYEGAICHMTNNKSAKTGKEMSGLSKRRLFDMALASERYNGNIPDVIKNKAQEVYNRGVELLRQECKTKGIKFADQIVGYNNDVNSYWGKTIQLQTY